MEDKNTNKDTHQDNKPLTTPAKDEQRKNDQKWSVQDEFEDSGDERIKMEGKISNAGRTDSASEESRNPDQK